MAGWKNQPGNFFNFQPDYLSLKNNQPYDRKQVTLHQGPAPTIRTENSGTGDARTKK